jgi:tetratricopeptide (TPR) repeat protein
MLRRAIELERSRPAVDWGELTFAFELLTKDAVAHKRFDEAADLLRRQADRSQDGQNVPDAAIQLFALHAYAERPLSGFERDLAVYGPPLGRPNMLDEAVTFARRVGSRSRALAPLAYAATAMSEMQRFEAADFLLSHGLIDAAANELRRTLAMVGPLEAPAPPGATVQPNSAHAHQIAANALFRLAHIAGEAGDDQAAADHLTQAMKRKDASGFSLAGAEEDVWAEIHARSLKAATKRGDADAARQHAQKLTALTPTNSDMALNALEALNAHGATAEADTLFERAFARMKSEVDAEPTNPQLLNNLAWLCARHGKRLDEALDFATRALAADPDNPALLDTAAEANFRLGKVDEAIRLETRALELRPDEKFMAEQLERFKAAKK